jgi:phosphatidylinositol alpha-mannosyltransferase
MSCRPESAARRFPALARIRRELRKWQPDVVHVHENHDPRLLALTAGYRTVFTIHDPVEHLGAREFSRIDTLVYRRWCSRAERFVIHSGTLVEELPPHIDRRRVVVIPHGTWPRPVPLPPPRQPVVLLFGRLEKYKGVDVLLAAMPRVWERRADVRLIVAGAGPAAKLSRATRASRSTTGTYRSRRWTGCSRRRRS